MIIEICVLIIVVAAVVHFTYAQGRKVGIEEGHAKGRIQVLEENLIREKLRAPQFDDEMVSIVDAMQTEEKYSRSKLKIAA